MRAAVGRMRAAVDGDVAGEWWEGGNGGCVGEGYILLLPVILK
jgi:hypothetical protein